MVCHRVVSHQSGLSSEWSLIRVVFNHQSDLSWEWSLIMVVIIRTVCHRGDLLRWSVIGWSFIRMVCHHSDLSHKSGLWSCYRHQDGVSSGPHCTDSFDWANGFTGMGIVRESAKFNWKAAWVQLKKQNNNKIASVSSEKRKKKKQEVLQWKLKNVPDLEFWHCWPEISVDICLPFFPFITCWENK